MNLNTEILSVLSNVKKFLAIPQEFTKDPVHSFVPSWKVQEQFLVVTALGTYTGAVMILDDVSKIALGIADSKTVLLPFETRRLQKIQAQEFCFRVLTQEEDIDAFQLIYLLELFDVEHAQMCAVLDLSAEEMFEIFEHDLELSVSECSEIAGFFLGCQQSYKIAC